MEKKILKKWLIYFLILLAILILLGAQGIILILIFAWMFFPRVFSKIFAEMKTKFPKKGIDISEFQSSEKPSSRPSFSSFFPPFMSPFQLNVKVVVGIVATLLVIFIIIDGLVSVPIGHVAVIYDRTRGVLKEELPEGLHLKIPFWQVATIVDTRLQEYTMSIATEEGRIRGDDSIEALTKDGQTVWIDATVRYRIQPDKASDILHEIGSDYDGIIIRPEVRSIIREIITGYESKQLFLLESRQEAAKEMQEKLQARYALHDIILDTLLLRNVQFSEVYLNAIEEKQVAEQKIQKAEFERQEAEIQKKTKIIEAEGESESIRLKGEALSKSPEVIQLEFVQKMAPQINWGILPDGAIPLLDVGKLQN